MNQHESGTPVLLDDIHSAPTLLMRIGYQEWPTAVTGSGEGDFAAAESHLQDFIALCPSILPLQHFSSTFHPSVCIGREVHTDVGSIDCLLVSGQGRVTIVETKLYKNPEARRAVVAQLLDYCDQISRFSYSRLDDSARAFVKTRYPEHEYSDLWSYLRWKLRSSQEYSEDGRDGDWLLEEEQFHEQTASSLRRGEMLGLIVGDRIDRRVVSLVEFAKSKPGLALELGLVELAFYRPLEQRKPMVVVPSVIERATPIARTVVDVRVDSAGAVHVNVEPVLEVPSVSAGTRAPQLASSLQFLELAERRAPEARDAIKVLLTKMQAISEASNGPIELDYGGASANLYWQINDEQRFRFFALEAIGGGRARVWTGYIRKAGYDQLASTLDNLTRPIVPVPPGQQSGAVKVLDVDTDSLLALVESLANAVIASGSAMQK